MHSHRSLQGGSVTPWECTFSAQALKLKQLHATVCVEGEGGAVQRVRTLQTVAVCTKAASALASRRPWRGCRSLGVSPPCTGVRIQAATAAVGEKWWGAVRRVRASHRVAARATAASALTSRRPWRGCRPLGVSPPCKAFKLKQLCAAVGGGGWEAVQRFSPAA